MFSICRNYLFESRATAFHVFQSTENVCKNWISTSGCHIQHVHIFDGAAIHETARREYLKSVVIHVYMYFTSQFQIVTVNESVY